jgi:CubicO group peptidase (beta-lactamase class C family)
MAHAMAALTSPLPWWRRTFDSPTSRYYGSPIDVGGETAAGFEDVRLAFSQNFEEGQERGAQFCVVWRGKKVVDLWGRQEHDSPYGSDSVQICMSCTKVLTAISVAMAVDRGYFKYEDLVSKYWPAFGKNGKETTTIEQVMRHEAGLPHLGPPALAHADLSNLELLTRRIEDAARDHDYHVDTDRAYHAITR